MRTLSMSLLLLLSAACATVPDFPTCLDLDGKGYCIWTISKKEQYVDDDTNTLNGFKWSELKQSGLIIPAESWVKLKEYILESHR